MSNGTCLYDRLKSRQRGGKHRLWHVSIMPDTNTIRSSCVEHISNESHWSNDKINRVAKITIIHKGIIDMMPIIAELFPIRDMLEIVTRGRETEIRVRFD